VETRKSSFAAAMKRVIAVALLVCSVLRVPLLPEPGSVEHIVPHSIVLQGAQFRLTMLQPGRHDAIDDGSAGILPPKPGQPASPTRHAAALYSLRSKSLPHPTQVGWSARAPPSVSIQIAT
jgi:hypothetical protein